MIPSILCLLPVNKRCVCLGPNAFPVKYIVRIPYFVEPLLLLKMGRFIEVMTYQNVQVITYQKNNII